MTLVNAQCDAEKTGHSAK